MKPQFLVPASHKSFSQGQAFSFEELSGPDINIWLAAIVKANTVATLTPQPFPDPTWPDLTWEATPHASSQASLSSSK